MTLFVVAHCALNNARNQASPPPDAGWGVYLDSMMDESHHFPLNLLQVSVRGTHGQTQPAFPESRWPGSGNFPWASPQQLAGEVSVRGTHGQSQPAPLESRWPGSGNFPWASPQQLAGEVREVGLLTYGVGTRAKHSLALEAGSAAHVFPQRHVAVWHGNKTAGEADWATKAAEMASSARNAALGALAGASVNRLAVAGPMLPTVAFMLVGITVATLWSVKVVFKGHSPWMPLPTPFSAASAADEAGHATPMGLGWIRHMFAECDSGPACPRDDRKLSVWDGTVLTFTAITGTGLLAMPYAFSLAGMVAAPILIFFVCCSGYTVHLMVWSFNSAAAHKGSDTQLAGWGSLMGVAFGEKAKLATDVFLIVEVWGYMLSFVVATVLNLGQIAEGMSTSTAIAISVTAAYSLTFVPRHILTRMNVLSNVVYGVCCLMFIVTGLLLPVKAPSSEVVFMRPQGLLSAAGILVFGPASHSFFPALMNQMEDPSEYPRCVKRAFGAALVFYLAMAIPGYLLFGQAVQPTAVRNIGVDLHLQPVPGLAWMHPVAAVGMVAKMVALQPIALSSLTGTVEGMLSGRLSDEALQLIVPPAILATTALAAVHFANEMGELINLIGSVFCMTIAFVVPVLCYWKLSSEPLTTMTRAMLVGLVAMGGSLAIVGALSAL